MGRGDDHEHLRPAPLGEFLVPVGVGHVAAGVVHVRDEQGPQSAGVARRTWPSGSVRERKQAVEGGGDQGRVAGVRADARRPAVAALDVLEKGVALEEQAAVEGGDGPAQDRFGDAVGGLGEGGDQFAEREHAGEELPQAGVGLGQDDAAGDDAGRVDQDDAAGVVGGVGLNAGAERGAEVEIVCGHARRNPGGSRYASMIGAAGGARGGYGAAAGFAAGGAALVGRALRLVTITSPAANMTTKARTSATGARWRRTGAGVAELAAAGRPYIPGRSYKLGYKIEVGTTLKVRAVKVKLKSGEIEILLTNLFDRTEYPTGIFKDLYFKRWGIETNYNAQKNYLQVECFSGTKVNSILQDFYAAIFIGNLQSVISNSCEEKITKKTRNRKYKYKINRNMAIGLMKNKIPRLFLDRTPDKMLKEITELQMKFFEPIRPNRTNLRKRRVRKLSGKYQTELNYKRVL